MIKASVIIPTKNPGPVFKSVLDAVRMQDVGFDYEILVIDSGSRDGTVEYLRRLSDARLRLLEILPSEFGHGRTRNLGVARTTGEYAVLLTHDARPASNKWLANLVAVADSDPHIAGVFGRHVAYPNASPFTAAELTMHFAGFEAANVVQIDDRERYDRDEGYRQYLHFFSDNNALIRRSVWESIPYPDVDFAEDQMWAQKIIEAGYKKGYAKDAVVEHSHDYAWFERLQRSFDESYAFRRLFGYKLCSGPRAMLRSWCALTLRDLGYAQQHNLWRTNFRAVVGMPWDHLMRLLGHYLGARGDSLPNSLRTRLSRDKRMLLGLLNTGTRESK
ncbi:glycosyltransferase family 2 protein [Cupriavidus cauae]|uniref:glycosyltransferase family 2 protein n=1 Tax=Cupriavidus cauae TaxID=2608999 RepID=UPI0022435462|nr:glycosyltransferase family 2 protein [Cupriavidus cauae]